MGCTGSSRSKGEGTDSVFGQCCDFTAVALIVGDCCGLILGFMEYRIFETMAFVVINYWFMIRVL